MRARRTRSRLVAVVRCAAVVASALAATVVAPAAVGATTADPAPEYLPSQYVALTPFRALDTRDTGKPLGPGGTVTVPIDGRLPQFAVAVVVTLTATAPTAPGFLTVYPSGTPRPFVSTLNKEAGETRSNSATVPLGGESGTVDVYNQAGTTHVVVDVVGYYDAFQGDRYHPVTPTRLADSREGPLGVPIASGGSVSVQRPSLTGGTVSAVAVNITAVEPTGDGYLRAWDGSAQEPFVSTVNYVSDRTVPTFAIVPVRPAGDGSYTFTVSANVAATHVVIDLVGEYVDAFTPGGGRYFAVTPRRLTDTREGRPLGPRGTFDTAIGVQAQAPIAVALNVTAVNATAPTFLTVYASDTATPFASNLNPAPFDVVPNAVQSPVDASGRFRVFNLAGSIDVVADLQGWFE